MPQVVIDNPILNSPFDEPTRHFQFGDEGITNETVEKRRTSSYFIPIAQPKKKGKQLQFETEWTKDRLEENRVVNLVRERVGAWRRGGHVGVTPTTSRLLTYWTSPEREKKLFFCQIEAAETAMVEPDDPGRLAARDDEPGGEGRGSRARSRPSISTRPTGSSSGRTGRSPRASAT